MKSKKILALLLALITITSSTLITSFAQDREFLYYGQYYLDTEIYCGYPLSSDGSDKITVEASKSDKAAPLSSSVNNDNRYKMANPDPRIAYLVAEYPDGSTQAGTGFFISDRVVATCAHVIINTDNDDYFPDKVTVYSGIRGPLLVSEHEYTGESVVVSTKYNSPNDYKYDYALVTIYETADVGYFGFTQEHNEGDNVRSIGYPEEDLFNQYGCDGSIEHIYPDILMTDLTSSHGHSGSPLFDNDNITHGILHGSDPDTHKAGFLKIDKTIFALFLKYRNDPDFGLSITG